MMMSARRNLELMERVSFERKLDWDSDDSDDLFNDEGGGGIRNGGFVLPPPFKGKHQLPAMFWRQWLFKKRGWGQTLMELISPLLMMSLVVWGWSRSTEDHFDMEFPVNSTIPLFKAVKNEYGTAQSLLQLCPPDKLLAQNVSPEELALIATLIREDLLQGLDGLQTLNSTGNMTLSDALINGELLIGGVPMSPVLISLAMKCVGSASELVTAFNAFDEYHGPLPVPSLDAFVGLGKLLRQALAGSDQPDEMLRFQSMFSWLLGNLLTHGRITFAPNSTEVSGLVNHLLSETEFFKEVYGGTFASEKDAVNSALINTENDKPIWAIVVVNKLDPVGGHVDYKIRMNFTTVPRTMRIVHRRRIGILTYYKHYYTSGFLSLQDAVNSYVFKLAPKRAGADTLSEKLMWGAPFPVPAHSRNKFYRAVGPMLGLVMCLTTLYPLGMLVKALVEEKETRVKETMYIMGLKSWVFSLSWATTYLAVFLLISLSVTLLLAMTVFPRSDPSLLFLLFFLFTTSLISFGFFLSVFFSKAKLAAIVAPFVYFDSIMPRYIFFRASDGQAIPGKSIAALLPPTAFTFGADLVAHYEGAMLGITWANIFEDEFSMAWILGLLLIDTFLYAVLAWYLEQVLPSEYGSRQPPWFLLSPNWWRGSHSAAEAKYQKLSTNMDEGEDEGSTHNEPYNAADGRQPAVKIRDLKKDYPGGKVAVENLTLEVYEGHITALLGHNGAGKSTTISILTGLIRPTGGDAHIWGHSIRDNMNDVRRTIGVCPQQSVLFSYLTVKEHLELFAALKGVPKLAIDQEVQDMVTRLGLSEKMNTPASYLSGGMKRKLQIGLAMMGESRVVFLDEPTSGLDPQSRRGVWELLRKFKTGRAIILTTHYMDEADLLCDRIAIMSEGRLKCSGSSLFLKAKFGVGYNLSMTRSSAACNNTALTALVHKHIPQAILLSSAGGELAFQLPLSNKGAFAQLFQEIEQKKEELHIGGYGVSMTTLEEVFLRLASDSITADEESAHFVKEPIGVSHKLENGNQVGKSLQETSIGEEAHLNKHDVAIPGSSRRFTTRSLQSSFARAYGQMLLKRVLIARRDWKGLSNSVLLPVLAISLVMLILKLNIDPAGPSLQLDFRIFKPVGQRIIIPVTKAFHNDMSILRANDYVKFQAQDTMNNSVALSEELLHTYWSAPSRFGALVFNDTLWPKLNTSSLRKLNITQVGGLFNISAYGSRGNPNTSTLNETYSELFQSPTGQGIFSPVTYLFNTTSDHALPALIQELMQARLKANLGNESAVLKVASHPLPLSKTEFMELQTVLAVLAALFVLIPFCYLGASYAVFVVRERTVKAKLLQMVSGASCVAYWSATYTWDLITYAATLSITMVVFELYQDKSFIGSWTKTGATLAVFMSFGASVIPLTYCYSFGFSNHANAQVAIAGIHFVTGFGMLVGSLVMGDVEETKALNEKLVHVYHLFPPYNLGRSLVQLSALDFRSQILGKLTDPFKWDILGRPLTYMIAEIFGYLLLTILIDNGTLLKVGGFIWAYVSPASLESRQCDSFSDTMPLKEDVDVSNERKRVEGGHACSDSVNVQGLRKVYPSGRGLEPVKVAVRDLSLGIPRGECFGFLGVNGAGKTTTLSILSGDIRPTSGEVYINGHSVLKNLPAAQKQIGYCPQFDPLLDLMTGREHLHMYAILKGVPKEDVTEAVNTLVQAVGLQKYVDRVAGAYSGGNKRKLALAIALVGNPAVVFLDEPSSGMDPVARRSMWNLITNAILERDMSVVLTTHSMEECEALCSRIGVMVAGSLICLGSIQHIKSRFGSGYTVEMRLARANSLETLHQFISLTFPNSRLEEEHLTRVKYSIPVKNFTLSQVFGALEKEKERLGLEDYSVCQSTLEQVFLSLANGQPEAIAC